MSKATLDVILEVAALAALCVYILTTLMRR